MIESIVAMLVGVAAGVASRDGTGIGAGIGGQQIAQRTFLAFTRGMERSADQAGVSFLEANNWSSQGLLDLFHHLEAQEALTPGLQDPYLRTHPLTRERIAFIEQQVAASPHSKTPLPDGFESGFLMVRAKLNGFLNPSSDTLRTVRADDPSPAARYARAIALYRLGHLAEALPLLDTLIAERKTSPWLHELKGQILFENGRVRESIGPYREAIRLAPDQPLLRISLAQAMVETGDPLLLRPAIRELQPALEHEHDNTTGWRTLATAWGKVGDIGQANLALAEEALANGNIPLARGLATRAESQLAGGPARLRAVDISNAVKKENRTGF